MEADKPFDLREVVSFSVLARNPYKHSLLGLSTLLPFRTPYPPRVDTERNDTAATSKEVIPPRVNHASVKSQIVFRSESTTRLCSLKIHLPFLVRFRRTSNHVRSVSTEGTVPQRLRQISILFRFVSTERGRSTTCPPHFR